MINHGMSLEEGDSAIINTSSHYNVSSNGSTSQVQSQIQAHHSNYNVHHQHHQHLHHHHRSQYPPGFSQDELTSVPMRSWEGQSSVSNSSFESPDLMSVNVSKPSPSSSNSSCFCRICHEGDGAESLVAPCKCTGTVALIHTSCLEHWLTSSNSDQCEICKFPYKIVREPRSCNDYLHDSANQFNVRNLIADIICFFLLTPLLIVSTYLCGLGANQYFVRERWEAVGLVILSMFLLAVYFTWCHVTIRFHMSMWKSWQQSNQQIRLADVNERNCVNNNNSNPRNRTPVRSPTTFSITNPLSPSRRLPFSNPVQPFVPLDEDLMDDSDTSRIIMV